MDVTLTRKPNSGVGIGSADSRDTRQINKHAEAKKGERHLLLSFTRIHLNTDLKM